MGAPHGLSTTSDDKKPQVRFVPDERSWDAFETRFQSKLGRKLRKVLQNAIQMEYFLPKLLDEGAYNDFLKQFPGQGTAMRPPVLMP